MKNALLFILFIVPMVAYAKTTYSPPYPQCTKLFTKSEFEFVQCVAKHHAQLERQFNRTFSRVLAKLDKPQRLRLVQSQKKWRDWVDMECTPTDPHFHSAYATAMIQLCEAEKMIMRERQLPNNALLP